MPAMASSPTFSGTSLAQDGAQSLPMTLFSIAHGRLIDTSFHVSVTALPSNGPWSSGHVRLRSRECPLASPIDFRTVGGVGSRHYGHLGAHCGPSSLHTCWLRTYQHSRPRSRA